MDDNDEAPQPLKDMLQLPLAVYPKQIVDQTRALAKKIATNCFGLSGTELQRLTEFLVMALMVFKRNSIKVSHSQYHAETDIMIRHHTIGWGLYMKNTRVLHSCMPNTYGVDFQGKTLACFAMMPIQPGERITATFLCGIGPTGESTEERRAQLKHVYNFHCNCYGCEKG